MNLVVTYAKKYIHTLDMGGFPDERLVEDKTKVVVNVATKQDIPYKIPYSPAKGVQVLVHPELTEQQIDKALIEFLWLEYNIEEHKFDIMR
jgi:hypothetical protein